MSSIIYPYGHIKTNAKGNTNEDLGQSIRENKPFS